MPSYSAETYDHPSWLVRFPHRRRMQLVADLLATKRPRRWLDFGAGDGALIRHLLERGALPDTEIVAYEPMPEMFRQLRENLGDFAGRQLMLASDLGAVGPAAFDLVTALEVLEHLRVKDRAAFYSLAATCRPGGCLIEVPVETGPVLALKEFGRVIIKRRRMQFTAKHLAKAIFGFNTGDAQGRYEDGAEGYIFTHFGFDLGTFEAELDRIGTWHKVLHCPFPMLPVGLNQCVMYELTVEPRDTAGIQQAILGAVRSSAAASSHTDPKATGL
mgnify:FL=1